MENRELKTGIVRKTDKLRRVVIPREICNTLGIRENTPMEIFLMNGDTLCLRKFKRDIPVTDFVEDMKRSLNLYEDDKKEKIENLLNEILEISKDE